MLMHFVLEWAHMGVMVRCPHTFGHTDTLTPQVYISPNQCGQTSNFTKCGAKPASLPEDIEIPDS